MQEQELIREALKARDNAYAPYSGFCVGACLEAEDGSLYRGCNIENASYSVTNCAERTAFFKAVSEGKRRFRRIVIVGGEAESSVEAFCPPCGVCRQLMMEFCDPDTFEIILGKQDLSSRKYLLKELMPMGFGAANLSV